MVERPSVAEGHSVVECEVIQLSPTGAARMLEGNTRNRTLRKPYVRKLAGAMVRGEWKLNGEPIQLAIDGTVLNGQHRLEAVVESGQTIPALVIRGLPLSAQMTMDTGARRSLSDVLALRGEKHTTNLAAALGLLHRYRSGRRLDQSSHTAPTPQEAIDLLDREPNIRESIVMGRWIYDATRMRIATASVLSYLFETAEAGAGVRFFEEVCAAEKAPPQTPVRALQSILERDRRERTYKVTTHALCAMTIKAFNAWCEGRKVTLLSYKPKAQSPEPFPLIRGLEGTATTSGR